MTKEELNRLIKEAEGKLREAGIESASAEVEIILEYLLDTDRINILLYGPDLVNDKILARFDEIVDRRVTRYPLQYILGEMYLAIGPFIAIVAVAILLWAFFSIKRDEVVQLRDYISEKIFKHLPSSDMSSP